MSRLMKASMGALACVAVAFYLSAAVPTDGGEWTIASGEVETLAAAATISHLALDGSLTLGAGAALTIDGATVNTVGGADGAVADMTIAGGASLVSQGTLTGANPGNTQGFSIGTFGGTGTVTVASGGSLTVTGGRLFLGRNKLTDGSEDRTKLSHGVINIFGTVTVPTVECGAWFPSRNTSVTYNIDELPVASVINLEEGGILETGLIQNNDVCRNIVNFKGGTLRLTREGNPLIYASVSTIWNIEEGKNLVFDSQSYHANLSPALHQPDSFKITGAGGLVKKGTGYLRICMTQPEMNTFTGPIVVEAGYLSIGRPLAEGQTVLVKSGAVFYPVAPSDLPKITYEDPADAPAEGSIYAVHLPIYGGLDLLGMSPTYVSDKIATTTWGWNGEVHGAVTHAADISLEHPFELVGQGRTLTLDGTGLNDLPLTVSGTGTFNFSGSHTNTTANAITFTGAATCQQSGNYSVQGENGAMPVTTISGGGTFKTTGELRAGYDGGDGAIVISGGANVTVESNIKIGSNESTRYGVKGRMEIENATVTTSGNVYMGANTLTNGTDLATLKNELVLGPGATLNISGHFHRNDDSRSRITFAGGLVAAKAASQSEFFSTSQNGVLEVEAKDGSDIRLNIGGYSLGATSEHTHFFGTGGLDITGTGSASTFTLGKAGLTDFSVAYSGATKLTDCALCLNVPLPTGSTVTGSGSTLFLNNVTITNSIVGDVAVKGAGTLVVGADGADCTFGSKIEGVALEKVGAGTLTLDKPFDGNLVVKEGTAVVCGAAYKSYRFKVEEMKGTKQNCMQFSELKLLNGGNDVTRPYKSVEYSTIVADGKSTFSSGENPEKVFDGDVSTKWCDGRGDYTRPASDREQLWVRINYDSPKAITGYSWYTANDYANRDPAAWRLQGSNDGGATWTDIDVRTGFSATGTRKALAFQSDLPGPCGELGPASRVVVEPGATLRISGGAVPASAIENNGGTVELANGATLTSDGGVLDGGVSGAGSLGVYGGNATLVGEQTYTGDTHVFGGTLNVGAAANPLPRAFDGKYFRLTIKRSNGGGTKVNNSYVDSNNSIQISEFQLYDEEGTNVCKGLTEATAGTAAYSLAAGKFACDRVHSTGSGETYSNLFDGNTGTKLYSSEAVDGTPTSWHVVVLRLVDSAAPVTAYNFYTANDYIRRSPSDWSLEGSRDGVTWELLDERRWAPHTTFTDKGKYSDNSIKTKPFNNGVNYQFETDVPPTFNGKFLRFTFKKTAGNTILQLSELMVFDVLGRNVAFGLVKGTDGAAATTLAPGSFCKGANYAAGGSGSEDMDKLFDDKVSTKLCATSNDMKGDSANYRVVTMRLAADSLPLSGYLFATANDSLNRSPSDWMVEGSVDGETWTTLDERAGIAQPYCLYTAMNAGRPFTFSSLAAGQGRAALPVGSVVVVDAGATLNLNDADATIGALRVDCTDGAGTINSFRPAAGGTLELVNIPAEVVSLNHYEVPLTVAGVQNAAALGSWKVTLDGVPRSYRLKIVDGKLTIIDNNTVIFVR